MKLVPTALDGVVELVPVRHGDERGWFSEVWNRATLADLGIEIEWVQDNEAKSAAAGTIRGLHFQVPPHAQDKLVRAVQGSILDVAVDLRKRSSTFGHHVAVELTADAGNQLLVPQGFAHGYRTLEPDTIIAYKVSDFYAPECDRAVRWDDPAIGIDWANTSEPTLSDKDRSAPTLDEIAGSLFD